jgi:hypothetical protein
MALYEIIYTSLASEPMTEEELTQLLDKARRHNQSVHVTGMMIYHRREFMQLLEGEQDDVIELYDKIAGDPRHQQIHKLWDGPIAERSFTGWTMAFVTPEGLPLTQREGYASLFDRGLVASTRDSTGKKLLLGLRDDFL